MKKEYQVNARPTANGTLFEIDVLHDGQYVSDMRRFFNHIYTGKGISRKIIASAESRAKRYVEELEQNGYEQIPFGGGRCHF